MSSENFLDDKKLKKLDNKLQKIISRSGIDKKTEDEVFDKYTLLTIGKLISDRVIDIIDFPISTGKEGNVFRAITPDKKNVVLKIYRITTSTFKHISEYILGDPRFSNIRKTRKDIVFAWTKKEFKNLERITRIGINAPKPIIFRNNVLVMQYIGTKQQSAPLLKDIELDNPEIIYKTIIDFIEKMYKKADLVHADLSPYNILIHKNKPYIIDLGQGVLIQHPQAQEYLKRDISNVVKFFNKYGITENPNKIYDNIINLKKNSDLK